MTFEEAFQRTIGHEGGFQNDPRDRGNWTGGAQGKGDLRGTKFGISAAAYPAEDIAGLTLERARELYRRDYWGPAGCDAVPPAVRGDLFDAAVHHGPKTAARMLQACVGEVEDGIVGPRTIQAASSMPTPRLIARFNGRRLALMADLPTWPAFGRGWARRIAANLAEA